VLISCATFSTGTEQNIKPLIRTVVSEGLVSGADEINEKLIVDVQDQDFTALKLAAEKHLRFTSFVIILVFFRTKPSPTISSS